MTLTELDAFLAFAQGQRRARVGDTCAALLATLRVVHQELMPWRSHFTGLELGFSGLDAIGTPVPETRFLIAPTAPSSWKRTRPADFEYALETVRTRMLRAFWPVFQELGGDGKAVSLLNLSFSRLEAVEEGHWFEHLQTAAKRVSPPLWAAWQQHRLNETMAAGHALADAPVRF